MTLTVLVLILLTAACCLGFSFGSRSRKHPLQNKTQAEALMYFLEKERLRHGKDIMRCKADMRKISQNYGIETPKADADEWISP